MHRTDAVLGIVLLVMALVWLVGCTPVRIYKYDEPTNIRGHIRNDLAAQNEAALTHARQITKFEAPAGVRRPDGLNFTDEWAWNHNKEEPPKLCLALSG